MSSPRLVRLALLTAAAFAPPARGQIMGSTPAAIDLADVAEAGRKASWSRPDVFKVNADGLGWGAAGEQGTRDFWLQTTEPIGIGLSWRPPSVAMIRATVERPGASGMLYARCSADAAHWTTWQLLEPAGPAAAAAATTESFRGTLRIPARDRARYDELRLAYARREDVPWRSDEEALAAEILRREPAFFEASPPFVGYIQLLYEAQLPAARRVKGLKVQVDWVVGGKFLPPSNPADETGRDGPWRFKAP